jgi:hypothetical protein
MISLAKIPDSLTFPNISRWQQSNLFVGISDDKIFFIFAYYVKDKTYYNFDVFNKMEDDFGEGWARETEVEVDIKNVVTKILGFKGKIWYTSAQDYELTPKIKRKIADIDDTLKQKTQEFIDKVSDKLETIGVHFSDKIRSNGLTKFEEVLLEFEREYSDLRGKYITIEDLIKTHSLNKMITAFLYFVQTNKVIDYEES